jgi:cell division protein FtsB
MDNQLKKILSGNNICGFTGETVDDLVSELKADNLTLKAENQQLKREIEKLREERKK